jgi:hypothetical protein
MNRGIYSTKKWALINPINDVEIYYNYQQNRNYDQTVSMGFTKVSNVADWLNVSTISGGTEILPGMFNLKLPLSVFGNKGYYTIYITPRNISTTIVDVSSLAAYPEIKGIVLDRTILPEDLEGYRVEYIDTNNVTRMDEFRIITSVGRCEPTVQNLNNSTQKSVRYRYTDTGSLVFCTVTPSSAQSFRPNSTPFIGKVGQQIRLINPKFSPVCVEVEMVDNDIDTLTNYLGGNQTRNLDTGILTTYTMDTNEIFAQYEMSTLKDNYTSRPIFDIKQNKGNDIDFTQSWPTITQDL